MRKVAGRAVTRRDVRMMMVAGAVMALVLGMVVLALPASAHTGGPTYYVRQILSGQSLHHWYTRAGSRKQHRESLTQPDDITMTGGDLFTGFQNGVGPQGQAQHGREPGQHDRRVHAERHGRSTSGMSGASATG